MQPMAAILVLLQRVRTQASEGWDGEESNRKVAKGQSLRVLGLQAQVYTVLKEGLFFGGFGRILSRCVTGRAALRETEEPALVRCSGEAEGDYVTSSGGSSGCPASHTPLRPLGTTDM